MNKLFIIGLPRTGTTSVSAALLDVGYKVAHTALTQQTFALAEVMSDTPCYCDYRQLDKLFPNSKFVYLDRPIEQWVPSVQMLLKKMMNNLGPEGRFHPVMKRCFNTTFELQTTTEPLTTEHLTHCYQQHQQQVFDYFLGRDDWVNIDVSQADSFTKLLAFLGKKNPNNTHFPHLNADRMVTGWKDIKHPNKINSNAVGPARRKFFDYAS